MRGFSVLTSAVALIALLFCWGEAAVFPDTPEVSSTLEVIGDTVVLTIENSLPQPLQDITVCEFSAFPVELLSVVIDGLPASATWTEISLGDVYPGQQSYRRRIESISSSVEVKYLLASGAASNLHWYAVYPFAIFSLFETCCQARGDVNHSGGDTPVDISDITFMVDYLFDGGDAPPCDEEADVNDADDHAAVDISDLTYLIDYFFGGGPPPPPCH